MSEVDASDRSLWRAITPTATRCPELRGSIVVDVAIVGAGLLGLSTALTLAERGARVALLETHQPGFGASGRNTGVVAPALKGALERREVVRLVGPDDADRLLALVARSGRTLFDLVARLGLDCSAEQTGLLQPAPTEATLGVIERQARDLEPFGAAPVLLDAHETRARTGIDGYRGALLLPSGGQINPLAYAGGLAEAAVSAGAALYQAHVTSVERRGAGWRLAAGGGTVDADTVVATTNALNAGLIPAVARSLVPVRVYQAATQPLGAEVAERLLPQRQPSVDLRHHPFAVRWSPDGRLVTGGGGLYHGARTTERMGRFFLHRLRRMAPDLPPLRCDYAWTGMIAGTGDFLPRVWEVGQGLFAPVGCNGRGIALTTALGQALGRYLLDRRDELLPVRPTSPRPWRLHAPMRAAPALWLAQARLKDWRDDRVRAR